MKYTNVTEGEFVGRNNRFTAEVLIGGVQETVNDLKKDDGITVKLSDGEAKCQVIGVLPESKEEIL